MSNSHTLSDGKSELNAFFRGQVVPLSEAKVSVMTHALHYGTGVFEGIRGNWNEDKGTVFIYRLREHYERLLRGCRMLMLDIPYSVEELCSITVDLVERNGHREDIYIRPLAYKSAEKVANLKLQDLSSDFTLIRTAHLPPPLFPASTRALPPPGSPICIYFQGRRRCAGGMKCRTSHPGLQFA